jgi:hypothetical protein
MRNMLEKPKPATLAQKVFGKDFDNAKIINERPEDMRSLDDNENKRLFQVYRAARRQQTKTIKMCLR